MMISRHDMYKSLRTFRKRLSNSKILKKESVAFFLTLSILDPDTLSVRPIRAAGSGAHLCRIDTLGETNKHTFNLNSFKIHCVSYQNKFTKHHVIIYISSTRKPKLGVIILIKIYIYIYIPNIIGHIFNFTVSIYNVV